MKKLIILTLFCFAFLMVGFQANAQTEKIIKLTDGSVLKGEVVAFNDGIYTIKTNLLGQIQIKDEDIATISLESELKEKISSNELKQKVEQIQGKVMADEELMKDIQKVMGDAEIMKLIQNPALIEDVLSFDENKIRTNESVNDLMKNPQIKNLMNKIDQKLMLREQMEEK